jgi:hypothetical protein
VSASYQADQIVKLFPEFIDDDGTPYAVVSASYALYDRVNELATAQPVTIFGVDRPELAVPANLNQLNPDETIAYRRVVISASDENGQNYTHSMVYFIKLDASLVVGDNSFAILPDLQTAAVDMIHLRAFANATEDEQTSALIQAWNNLGQLPVRFDDLEGTDSYDKGSTRELIDADINILQPKTYQRLIRAQIIEADDVLGGNPIEARRRLGLISDSSGESAHFFRTSKPLNLPCCRAAIDELRGIVNWGARIGRG